jgi:hypothetical protein
VPLKCQRSFPSADWDNRTDLIENAHGENLGGFISQNGSKCVKQDETSLSLAANTPKLKTSSASRRTSVRRRHEPGVPANASSSRAELVRTLGLMALAALMGLTSWVIASISTWMVPVYVSAMVLIFVFPQSRHHGESEQSGKRDGVDPDERGEVTRPAGSDTNSPSATYLEVDALAAASAKGSRPHGSSTTKRRRPRSQGRRPAQPAPESVVASTPAAWIRVGPGKFVRADSRVEGFPSAPLPHTNATSEATKAPGEVESPVRECGEETHPASMSTVILEPTWEELEESGQGPQAAPEPITGEYGIAPSAFGSGSLTAFAEEDSRDQGLTGLPGASTTGARISILGRPGSGQSGSWCGLQPRSSALAGFTHKTRRKRQQWSSRIIRSERERYGFAEHARAVRCKARLAVQRDFGRSFKVHRGYQPRSPPGRW